MKQDEQRYNGWTNYETWVTALWLDNEQATQDYWREVARMCRADGRAALEANKTISTVDQAARLFLVERLQEEVAETTPLTDKSSLYADLLGAALERVNWYEIADHWLENLDD